MMALARVQAIYAGECTWDDFVAEFSATDDPPIVALVHLAGLEPDMASPTDREAYRAELERAVLKLEAATAAP